MERKAGLTFPGLYALMAKAHMQKYGTTRKHLASVSVKNHYHASMNDKAQFPYEVTEEKVLNSPQIVEPFTLFDSSPISDGAAAVILSSEDDGKGVYITGSAVATDTVDLSQRESLTEIKATKEDVNLSLPEFPYHIWNSAQKKGYSGTAVFSKHRPLSVDHAPSLDTEKEGRISTLEFPSFYLVNVYTPNAQRELTRLAHRQQWDRKFLGYLKELQQKKPVIFCGDLNVAHQEIDLAHPQNNRQNAGFTDEERQGFSKILEHGFLDSFREFNKEPGQYTWWSYMFNARAKNIGWRIDYFCLSTELRSQLEKAFILPQVKGSDHCPVGLILK